MKYIIRVPMFSNSLSDAAARRRAASRSRSAHPSYQFPCHENPENILFHLLGRVTG